jgi:hypothetical protein
VKVYGSAAAWSLQMTAAEIKAADRHGTIRLRNWQSIRNSLGTIYCYIFTLFSVVPQVTLWGGLVWSDMAELF